MADLWKRKCLACNKDVTYPHFSCGSLPSNHKLEPKTYYHLGGRDIRNERDRRGWAPLLILRPGIDKAAPAGIGTISEPSLTAQFSPGGVFATDDAELQYYLDMKGLPYGELGLREWQKVYLSMDQRKTIAENELATTERKIKENNDLLAQTQHRVRGAQPTA